MLRSIAGCMAALAVVLIAGTAAAVPVKWTIPSMTLSDGGTISGSFTFDADTGAYSDINIVTAGGTRPGLNTTYVRISAMGGYATQLYLHPAGPNAQTAFMWFSAPLTNAGGAVAIGEIHEAAACLEPCTGFAVDRSTYTPGSITGAVIGAGPTPVPTMSEWAMILFGAILAGGTALYLQRRRQSI
jgi:hypothetical protein